MVSASRVAIAVLAVFGCAACTAGPAVSGGTDRYQPDLTHAVDEARDAGAGPQQLALLETAVANGEMSYDQLSSLLPNLFECYEQAGFRVGATGHSEDVPGLPVPDYQAAPMNPGTPIDTQAALMNKCDNTYYASALGFYVSQPKAMDLYYADFEARRPEIEGCLRERGFEVDGASTNDDIMRSLYEDANEIPCFDGDIMPFD